MTSVAQILLGIQADLRPMLVFTRGPNWDKVERELRDLTDASEHPEWEDFEHYLLVDPAQDLWVCIRWVDSGLDPGWRLCYGPDYNAAVLNQRTFTSWHVAEVPWPQGLDPRALQDY